jgi:hypothetical protein
MVRALMLEGPRRGNVIESRFGHLSVAVMHHETLWRDELHSSNPSFTQMHYVTFKMTMFEATFKVWVPSHLSFGAEMSVWALHRLIDPSLHSGLTDVADVPPEWLNPTIKVRTERTKEIEDHV